MLSVITVYSILIIFVTYNSVLSVRPPSLIAICSVIFILLCTLYILPATLFSLRSMLYDLPSKPISALP